MPEVVVERHRSLTEERVALFSPDHDPADLTKARYRYVLEITWDKAKPRLVACMLNPSTATHLENDPTIHRVSERARMLGFGGVIILNIFAWRDTKPERMKAAAKAGADVVGPENDRYIRIVFESAASAGWVVLFGWGNHGSFLNRYQSVLELARAAGLQPQCLKVSSQNQPWHPLYCGYDWPMFAYQPPE